MTAQQIRESKDKALEKIKKFLEAGTGNVDKQFDDRTGNYYSDDKFIVTWNAMYKGMTCEYAIDKTDAFYANYSGYKCIYSVRNLFLEKQMSGYPSIEFGLLSVGINLCQSKADKIAFYEQYITPYNNRIKELKNK